MKRAAEHGAGAGSERVELPISGMTCAACARRVERALADAPGVTSAGVNFATSRATVEFDPARTKVDALVRTVRSAGYDASPDARSPEQEDAARDEEHLELRRRFWVGAVLALPVLVLAMAHGQLDFAGSLWVQMALTAGVLVYSGRGIFRGAWLALLHRAADMNTLIAVGTGTAFVYSVVATVWP